MSSERPEVLIAGAGYAGLNAALHLAERRRGHPDDFGLALVDQHPYHLVKIRLHEAAVGAPDIVTPLHGLFGEDRLTLHHASVDGFDLANKRVNTSAGPLSYDYLLLALGSTTNFFGIPGLPEHSFALDSLAGTVGLRGHIEEQVVLAADSADPAERERRLRFVIGGAGYTGIELAGELAELLPNLCERIGLDRRAGRVIVVDAGPRILPVLDEELASCAAQELERKGVEFHSQVKVTGCSGEGVTVEPGGLMPTATMIWAGGIRANPLVESAAVAAGKQGRLVVDATLRLPSHPEVFVAGDCSLALNPSTSQPLPATAQLALQEGRWAAVNILRALASEEPIPFDPASRGEVVSLGHDRAVGWTRVLGDRQLKLRGLVGGLAKRAAEAEWEVHLWRETHHLDDIFA